MKDLERMKVVTITKDMRFVLNTIFKRKCENCWDIHFYVDCDNSYGYGIFTCYNKRIVDYLRYFQEESNPVYKIDISWLVHTYEACMMDLFKKN